MTFLEALYISVLSVSVVFSGLVLIISFINVFNRATKHIEWEGAIEHNRAPAQPKADGPAEKASVQPPAPKKPVPAPSPDVFAVIATVIEIEQRLYQSHGHQHLTIRR